MFHCQKPLKDQENPAWHQGSKRQQESLQKPGILRPANRRMTSCTIHVLLWTAFTLTTIIRWLTGYSAMTVMIGTMSSVQDWLSSLFRQKQPDSIVAVCESCIVINLSNFCEVLICSTAFKQKGNCKWIKAALMEIIHLVLCPTFVELHVHI